MSLNKALIIGRLGQDPEVRNTPSGHQVCEVSIACSDKYKGQEKTEWIKVVFWNKQAELAGQYLKKGSQVYIEGQIKTDEWQDKDGNKRYTTKVHAWQMQFLDSKPQNGQPQQQSYQQQPSGNPGQFNQQVPPQVAQSFPDATVEPSHPVNQSYDQAIASGQMQPDDIPF